MDIKQAIERVRGLDDEITRCESFLAGNMETTASVRIVTSSLSDIHIKGQIGGAEGVRRMVEAKAEKLRSERAKLQPVIDMANAALKGIGA